MFAWPTPKYPNAKLSYPWPGSESFRGNPSKNPEIPEDLCSLHAFDQANDPELLANGKDCFKPYSKKFQLIDEGDVSGKSFKRLHRFRYSPTAWYGNNEVHLHPWKPRRISVREAMRLQSIPDSYVMPADIPLSTKFKTVCNGVPCLLAKGLAVAIDKFIEEGRKGVFRKAVAVSTNG
jgi:DNA (cytosine-5)-methyltransferase 1